MGLVLAGRKTATSSALRDYEEDARQRAEEGSEDHDAGVDGDVGGDVLVRTDVDLMLPESGMLNILLDGSGLPRALIRLTDVQVVRFADVTAEHAHREGEGDRSLNHWRREHRHFFERSSAVGEPVDDDTMVVLESFEVLVPPEARRAARKDRG